MNALAKSSDETLNRIVMPDFSVVICAYTQDRWKDLVAAVQAVQAQTVSPWEILVVVDHNPDLWQRVCLSIPGVIVLENAQQPGLSGARNSGVKAAWGEIIAFVDEDAVPATDWLERLSQGYTDPCVLGVGGAIEPMWTTGRPGWFPKEFDWVVGCTYQGMPSVTAPVRNLIGCNMSFRREVFDAIGGFRHGIGRIGAHPLGCEETELCIRIHRRWPQAILAYEPSARVFHRIPSTRTNWEYFRSRCYYEGRSKATVAALTGSRDGLATEWNYTLKTLPRGIYRGLLDWVRGDSAALARAGAILAGLAIATAGYLTGRLLIASKRERVYRPSEPVAAKEMTIP